MDDFDEIFDEHSDGVPDDPPVDRPEPSYRATIRGGKLMLTGWAPWLISGGPVGHLLPARGRAGVTIADLTIHGADEDELSVRFFVRAEPTEAADEILIGWARQVGYRRLWLPDRLVTLERDPEIITRAKVRCGVCRAKWSDASPEFWLVVHQARAFPRFCPACGCEMPQWTTEPTRNPGSPALQKDERWSSSGSQRRTRPNRR